MPVLLSPSHSLTRISLGILIAANLSAQTPAPVASPQAAWTKKTPWGEPDLSGVWQQRFVDKNGRPVVGLDLAAFTDIPYQPWSKEKYDYNKTSKGQAYDPESACLPAGVPRSTGLPYPFRLLQQPGLIAMLIEGNVHTYRMIFMDGKPHPEDVNPTWMGHSTGKWEGTTLVIDSVGFNDKTWLDPGGHVHTDKLHTIERFTRTNKQTIDYKIIIDDAGAYTKPYEGGFNLRYSENQELFEYVCQQANYASELMVGDKTKVDRTSQIVP